MLTNLSYEVGSLSISKLRSGEERAVPRVEILCSVSGVEKHPDQTLVITGDKGTVSGSVLVRLSDIKV